MISPHDAELNSVARDLAAALVSRGHENGVDGFNFRALAAAAVESGLERWEAQKALLWLIDHGFPPGKIKARHIRGLNGER
jgi:hypothetical protein